MCYFDNYFKTVYPVGVILTNLNTMFGFTRFLYYTKLIFLESWVIYRGSNSGISKLIYDAFKGDDTNKNTMIAIRPAKKRQQVYVY